MSAHTIKHSKEMGKKVQEFFQQPTFLTLVLFCKKQQYFAIKNGFKGKLGNSTITNFFNTNIIKLKNIKQRQISLAEDKEEIMIYRYFYWNSFIGSKKFHTNYFSQHTHFFSLSFHSKERKTAKKTFSLAMNNFSHFL